MSRTPQPARGGVYRPWMKRIPDWQPGQEKAPAWEEDPAGKPLAPDEEGAEGEAEMEPPDGEEGTEQAAAGEGEAGPPEPGQEGAPSGGEALADPPPAGPEEGPADTRLDVPDEVEERRREEADRKSRFPRNLGLAGQAFSLKGHYLRNLATHFARVISKVAEDSADMPAQGDEEWDVSELIRRRFTGRHVNQCRMTREKRKVAIVLDTSPSCEHQARLFGTIARIAEELGDCEIYDAPNFGMVARKLGDEWETLHRQEQDWDFQGRAVLAFGDFDGLDRICEASAIRGNRIYWFCCEERAQVLEMYREQFLKRFKGFYHPANNTAQLMKALGRVR